jgi:hypothetical protein
MGQKLGRQLGAPACRLGEEGLQGRAADKFGRMPQSPFAVLASFDQAVQDRSRV